MSTNHTELSEDRLRIVFNDTVVSFDLAVDITFDEVAQALNELSTRRSHTAVAVDVPLAPPADRARPR